MYELVGMSTRCSHLAVIAFADTPTQVSVSQTYATRDALRALLWSKFDDRICARGSVDNAAVQRSSLTCDVTVGLVPHPHLSSPIPIWSRQPSPTVVLRPQHAARPPLMPSLKMLANLAYALAHLCRHAVAWAISWVQVPIAVALIIAGAAIGAADAVFRTRDKSIAGRALERALRTVYTYGTRPAHRSLFITSGALARWSLTLRGFQFRDLQTPSGGRVVSIKRRDAVGTADVMILHVHGEWRCQRAAM